MPKGIALLTAFALLGAAVLCSPRARADEFGELPRSLESPAPTSRAGADFRDLLRQAAPVAPAEAAEPAPDVTGGEVPQSGAAALPPTSKAPEPAPTATAQGKRDSDHSSGKGHRFVQRGLAAWYQHPGKTASGEIYNPNRLTAAHRTLPMGTMLRVVAEKTGKEVTVRVTDRVSRIALSRRPLAIELSRKGAQIIGLKGVGMVTIYEAAR